jgi:hypothetical protein
VLIAGAARRPNLDFSSLGIPDVGVEVHAIRDDAEQSARRALHGDQELFVAAPDAVGFVAPFCQDGEVLRFSEGEEGLGDGGGARADVVARCQG